MIVNNRETNEGDAVFYVDEDKQIYDAIIKSVVEKDGNSFAELKVDKDGQHFNVENVPHNTSTEKHSWNHPRLKEEVELHYKPDFYGELPRKFPPPVHGEEPEDVVDESNYHS